MIAERTREIDRDCVGVGAAITVLPNGGERVVAVEQRHARASECFVAVKRGGLCGICVVLDRHAAWRGARRSGNGRGCVAAGAAQLVQTVRRQGDHEVVVRPGREVPGCVIAIIELLLHARTSALLLGGDGFKLSGVVIRVGDGAVVKAHVIGVAAGRIENVSVAVENVGRAVEQRGALEPAR